jgi:hypothetical protein
VVFVEFARFVTRNEVPDELFSFIGQSAPQSFDHFLFEDHALGIVVFKPFPRGVFANTL